MTSMFGRVAAILLLCGLAIGNLVSQETIGGTPGRSATGTVTSVSSNSLSIRSSGKDFTFTIDGNTKVSGAGTATKGRGGKTVITDTVKTSDQVSVTYRETKGSLLAASVRVNTKTTKK